MGLLFHYEITQYFVNQILISGVDLSQVGIHFSILRKYLPQRSLDYSLSELGHLDMRHNSRLLVFCCFLMSDYSISANNYSRNSPIESDWSSYSLDLCKM